MVTDFLSLAVFGVRVIVWVIVAKTILMAKSIPDRGTYFTTRFLTLIATRVKLPIR